MASGRSQPLLFQKREFVATPLPFQHLSTLMPSSVLLQQKTRVFFNYFQGVLRIQNGICSLLFTKTSPSRVKGM
jgi:hypothetical protein